MKNIIYNQLNFEPRVFGVPFFTLMILCSSLVLSTTILLQLVKASTAVLYALIVNLISYLVVLKISKLEGFEFKNIFSKTLKKDLESVKNSTQGLIIK